jgi:hypothetical protein
MTDKELKSLFKNYGDLKKMYEKIANSKKTGLTNYWKDAALGVDELLAQLHSKYKSKKRLK